MVLTGCRKGAVPTALTSAGPAAAGRAARPAGRGLRPRQRGRGAVGPRRPARHRPQRRPGPVWPSTGAWTWWPPTTSTTPPPARRPLATALAAVRARRPLAELDGWLPSGGHRPPALRCGAGASLRPLARGGGPGRRARAGRAPSTSIWWRRGSPTAGCPPGTTSRAGWWSWRSRGATDRYGPRHDERRARRVGPDRPRARGDRHPRLRRVLPHRLGHRGVLPPPGHLLPGPGLGRQLRRLLRPGHHPGRRRGAGAAVRTVPLPRARRSTRHRRRHRVGPARGGHRLRLRALRPSLTPPRSPTSSPTAPARPSATSARPSGTAPRRSTCWAKAVDRGEPLDRGGPLPPLVGQPGRDGPRLPPPPRPALGGDGALRPARHRGVPGGVGAPSGAQRPAVGQGRLRRGRVSSSSTCSGWACSTRCTAPST